LPSTFYQALDKDFAECHSALGKEKSPSQQPVIETAPLPSVLDDTQQRDYFFVECPPTHTRQSGHQQGPLLVSLPSALGDTWQSLLLLSSVRVTALDKEALPVPRCSFSAECYDPDTRQSDQYTPFLFVFAIPSKQTKYNTYTSQISHNHHRYHIYITYLTNTINQTSSHSITNMFGHKHKYPTLKNISLKYLTKSYQHLTSSDRVISQSMNNNKKDNISSMWAAGLVRRWLGNP
jgi:hypothetical protein